ncbi:winged helix-turn-helix domain-containing protein [Edaphovirga cremea]|uniref:winged helix-turn-helix domain-containing protein n=1 Tax=Edaphovirga cremea TaxID=2267246 RepID=UPI000DEED2BF|nr:winged helix-turn-helix domain-containing protein [Edaphovirga cremea]
MLKKENLYGYIIKFDNGYHIQVDLLSGQLLMIPVTKKSQPQVISAKRTKMKLLCYLLEKANNNYVSREELLREVWEASNLSSSYQRLSQVTTKLTEELLYLNAPIDFIIYCRGKGYTINCSQILRLHFNAINCNEISS